MAIKTEDIKDEPEVTAAPETRIGANGKHYCGKEIINGCKCCLHFKCGEVDGCNCIDCQRLDIKKAKVRRWHLVNKYGRVSRLF